MLNLVSTLAVIVGALTTLAQASDSYSWMGGRGRKLGEKPLFQAGMYASQDVATCYGAEYTYYKSWTCTGTIPCTTETEINLCPEEDPLDYYWFETRKEIDRLLTIIVPSVAGGLLFCFCLCGCCCCYYGTQYVVEWRAKQKRMKPQKQPSKTESPKKADDESESDFDRSQAALRKRDK